jgi:hypothetical protein
MAKENDEKVAKEIRSRFIHARVSCDDGNVHVKFPEGHKIDAEDVASEYCDVITTDGVQDGQVCVWVGEEWINED